MSPRATFPVPGTWFFRCLVPALVVGCASARTYPAFFGRRVEPLTQDERANQGGDAITAEGSVASWIGPVQMSLRLSNHGISPMRLSYVMDEYVAKTYNGRTVALEKTDFLNYPDVLKPGDEAVIPLQLPKDYAIPDIAQLVVMLHDRGSSVVLRPLNPTAPLPDPIGARLDATAPPPSSAAQSDPTADWSRRVPIVPESAGLSSPGAPPIGTVPVEVEFRQRLGASLSAEVQWDASPEPLSLSHGDRQLFYVVPGPHELQVTSRISGVQQTSGRVSIVVSTDRPTRVALEARARFTGVELHVQVFHGTRIVSEQTFTPGPHG